MDAAPNNARPIIVHSLAHALAAATVATQQNTPLHLTSASGAASTTGVGWFASLGEIVAERFPGLPLTLTLDCGDVSGLALGALRRGLHSIVFSGDPVAARRLTEIAQTYGAVIEPQPLPALDLLDAPDPNLACVRWFSVESGATVG